MAGKRSFTKLQDRAELKEAEATEVLIHTLAFQNTLEEVEKDPETDVEKFEKIFENKVQVLEAVIR
jgi:Zn-finger domain-containing protein